MSTKKFKVGDTVIISPFLKSFDHEEGPGINIFMIRLAGEYGVIERVLEPDKKREKTYYVVRARNQSWNYLSKWLIEDTQINIDIKDIQEVLNQ